MAFSSLVHPCQKFIIQWELGFLNIIQRQIYVHWIAVNHFFEPYIILIDCNHGAFTAYQKHLLDRAIKRGLATLNIPVLVAVRKYLMEADIFLSGEPDNGKFNVFK